MSRSSTISERATVIPPPVKGCLMLNASPMRRAPGVGLGIAGIVLFGMDRMFPFSMAARNEACIFSGSCNHSNNSQVLVMI